MNIRDRFKLSTKGEIYINNRSLIDIVKEIELPYAQIEYDARIEEGEDPSELYVMAGDYIPLPLSMVKSPSRHLLDKPLGIAEKGFILPPDDPSRNKTTLLGCSCGIIECWFLLAQITLTKTTVQWSDFQQFHRQEWKYNLSFIFDRHEYEAQLQI